MKRTEKYRKRKEEEDLLEKINRILEPVEAQLINKFDKPHKPTIFIVGAPRSATTLIHQLLAQTGAFGYISNYLARFWKAPYLGALQEKVLGVREQSRMSFFSDFGRTKGWHEPHQFNYFWQKWFRFNEDHQMDHAYLDSMNIKPLSKEVAALEHLLEKPMLFKSLYCGLQIGFLKRVFPNSRFVVCTRSPLYQAQSILSGRKAFFGNYDGWFSLKPPNYHTLRKKTAYEQVVGQIYFILKAIGDGLNTMKSSDYLILDQVDLTKEPKESIELIIKMAEEQPSSYNLDVIPDSFENRNVQKLDDSSWEKLEDAEREFFKGRSCLEVLVGK